MLVTSLSLATLLLLWMRWWRMRRNPLAAAAQAIFDVLADLPCIDDGPPSRRTRSAVQSGTTSAAKHEGNLVNDRARVRRERERVRHFARAVRSLQPMRGGRAIRCVARLKLQIPDVTWTPHRSGKSLLEHCDLLPRLQSANDDAAAEPLHRCYAEQRHMRRRGNSYALWQMAHPGAVTLPHVDDDLNGVGMGTYIAMVEGAQLIVAWRRGDLHEAEVLRGIHGLAQPSLSRLESVPSLTILRAAAGDLIYMPKDTVHMVITEKRKVQLAYHVYE